MAKKEKNYTTNTYPAFPSPDTQTPQTGGSGGGAAADTTDLGSILSAIMEDYAPQLIEYKPADANSLSAQIAQWLRPLYDKSVSERQRLTEQNNAELDADAIARGMGSSTFVSDMKNRSFNSEAEDIAYIESEYGATLAKHLYDALQADKERQLEVETFNANAQNEAYAQAFDAATALYESYLNSVGSRSSSGSSSGSGSTQQSVAAPSDTRADRARSFVEALYDSIPATSAHDCELYMASANPRERERIYNGTDSKHIRMRAEIIKAVGAQKFRALKNRYPAER